MHQHDLPADLARPRDPERLRAVVNVVVASTCMVACMAVLVLALVIATR